jgi:hypothetical protein
MKYYPSVVQDPRPILSRGTEELTSKIGKEISIEIKSESAFRQLPSALLQREVLQRIYKIFSKRESLSYELTCQIMALVTEKSTFGKREKVLHLDKEISVVRIGYHLIFTRERLRIFNSRNAENDKTLNNLVNIAGKELDMVENAYQKESDISMSVAGISIKCPKVCKNDKIGIFQTFFYPISNVSFMNNPIF